MLAIQAQLALKLNRHPTAELFGMLFSESCKSLELKSLDLVVYTSCPVPLCCASKQDSTQYNSPQWRGKSQKCSCHVQLTLCQTLCLGGAQSLALTMKGLKLAPLSARRRSQRLSLLLPPSTASRSRVKALISLVCLV